MLPLTILEFVLAFASFLWIIYQFYSKFVYTLQPEIETYYHKEAEDEYKSMKAPVIMN